MTENSNPHSSTTAAAVDPWKRVMEVPGELSVQLKIPALRLRDLLCLRIGSVIDTRWSLSTDVPLLVNGQLIAWSEFEAIGEQLAVRLSELV